MIHDKDAVLDAEAERLMGPVRSAISSDHWLSACYDDYGGVGITEKNVAYVYCYGRDTPVLKVTERRLSGIYIVFLYDPAFQWAADRILGNFSGRELMG